MAEIVLGVSGGIAAYKSAELLRLFTESGHSVRVVPTASSLNFVGAATWEALSGKPVQAEVFEHVDEVAHLRIGQGADLVVVAPATANVLAKAAHGLADDLLTNTLLTARCPVMFVPAMHTEMWEHPATRANVEILRSRGCVVLEPAVGRLTGVDTGKGRLPAPAEIFSAALNVLDARVQDLSGTHVVVSAGGTREFLDPVRYLGNRSSGRMGLALAKEAAARGAEVTTILANVLVPRPDGVRHLDVETAEELGSVASVEFERADVLVMAAAVGDFRPSARESGKIAKLGRDGLSLELEPTTDVLAALAGERRPGQTLVGFAAEHGDGASVRARAKLARKGLDAIVLNDVSLPGIGFESADNEVTIVTRAGELEVPRGSKAEVAAAVMDTVEELRRAPVSAPEVGAR